VWKHFGKWTWETEEDEIGEQVYHQILHGLEIRPLHQSAPRFDRSELASLTTLLLISLAFGICVADDLFVVPDHGNNIIQTSHHDVLHVACRSTQEMQEFVRKMDNQGYCLPSELPDDTFKKPNWMH